MGLISAGYESNHLSELIVKKQKNIQQDKNKIMQIVSFSGSPNLLSEQQQTQHFATFNLTEPTPAEGLAIDFDFSGSTAVPGVDFDIDLTASENIVSVDFLPDGSGGTVYLAGGVTTATVVSAPLIDADGDAEIIDVQLIDGEGYELDPDNSSFTATITDEPIVSFSGSPNLLSEQQQTQHFATFNLTEPTPAEGLAVDFDFSGSTAVPGVDFDIDLAASENIVSVDFLPDNSGGTVYLAGGVTTATVVSAPLIDADGDAEIINVQLIDGEGFELAPDNSSFTATITDEPIVSVSASPNVLSEQQQTQHVVTFSITEPTPAEGLAIDFDFSASTAVAGVDLDIDLTASENIVSVDFLPDGSGGTVNLAGGVTTATVVAFPLIDADGDSEFISVQLIDGEGFELDPDNSSFTATITDEPIVSVSATPNVLSEQQQTQHVVTFSITEPTPAEGLAIDFDFSASTAVAGVDLDIDLTASENIVSVDFLPDGSGGTVNLAGGVTTATVVAFPLIDADGDSEFISVQLIDGEGFELDPDNSGFTATIVDFNEIIGGNGKDFLQGDQPGASTDNDLIYGGNGKDTLVGGKASDILYGENGKDFLRGGEGDDTIYGGNGKDTLLGGEGRDILYGENGKDFLRGGEGDDTIYGGNGADIFVLAEGEGTDTITDFGNGNDIIGLADGLTFSDLSFSGSNIIVTATSETLATLTGINTTTLTADDFTVV